jgi:Leucine-rich repeat (LRR) protein
MLNAWIESEPHRLFEESNPGPEEVDAAEVAINKRLGAIPATPGPVTSTGTFFRAAWRDDGAKSFRQLAEQVDHLDGGDGGLKGLRELNLAGTKVTDAGLKELKALKNLETLNLDATKVTDAGVKKLKDVETLQHLSLRATKVTVAGLKELKDLKGLRSLDLNNTEVTEEGVKELKEVMPRCVILG